MSTDEKMTIDERRKYVRMMKPRYAKAHRKEKGRLLDEMEAMTGCDRKYLIRLLKGDGKRRPRQGGRRRTYGSDVDDALRVISESLDNICAERLTPNLVWLAKHLARHGEMAVSDGLLVQLEQISISTVGRILRRIRQDERRLPRRAPRRENGVLRDIPMLRLAWDIQEPGYFEVDLVHHCGPSSKDLYMCSIQWIDVATGWSERRAVLGRGQLVMEDAFRAFLGRLPFPVLGIHPDNDSAFFNHHMLRFWGQLVPGISLSRSRPYHKNDNPRVEQKNRTLIRAFLGDHRLDTVAHALAANQLYDQMWVYYNLFQPVMHLKEKHVIQEEGQPARIIRRFDKAQTPFDRLCKTKAILPHHKQQIEALRDVTNPRQLRQEIEDAINGILSLPPATPGQTESVFDTLAHSLVFDNPVHDPLDFGFSRTTVLDEPE
jgi:hypothetical protein